MPELFVEPMFFSSIDEGVERFRAFARAHPDFEPSLVCERDKAGRRRWTLTVGRRTEREATANGRRHEGALRDE